MTDGVLTAGGPHSWWAWAGAQLTLARPPAGPAVPEPVRPAPAPAPAPALPSQHISGTITGPALQTRDIHGNVVINLGEQRAAGPDLLPWLGALWQACADTGAAVELRLLNNADHTLTAYLLWRAAAQEQSAALAAVTRLRDSLSAALPQVTATPVLATSRLGAVLEPFVPHQSGIVEIRKRVTVARSTRTDTPIPWLAAVTPLAGGGTSWQPVWAKLAAFAAPALLTVRLEPFRIGPGLRAHLAEWASEFARLAVPGPPPNPTWPKPRPADPFAATARAEFASAVDRYIERAFRIRISLAASVAMTDDLAQLLANTISPPRPDTGFLGDAPTIIWPGSPEHAMTAWRNITALNADPIGRVAPAGFPEDSVGDVARALTTIADIHEAASVFRPPYPVDGSATRFAD